jgi:hypothetical protein
MHVCLAVVIWSRDLRFHVIQRHCHVTFVTLFQYSLHTFSSLTQITQFLTFITMVPLNAQYTAIASSLLDDFIAKKRDERAAVVESAVQQITALAEKNGLQVPPFLHKVCSTLLHHHFHLRIGIAEA